MAFNPMNFRQIFGRDLPVLHFEIGKGVAYLISDRRARGFLSLLPQVSDYVVQGALCHQVFGALDALKQSKS